MFYAERDENARKYAALQQQLVTAEDDGDDDGDATPDDEAAVVKQPAAVVKQPAADDAGELSMEIFAENWNDSQFWVCFPGV